MKKSYKNLFCASLMALAMGIGSTSCTDYLDKSPDSTVSGDEAFKNFTNFQGYIEEIYNCIPDKEKCNWCPSWNWGDDEIWNPEGNSRMTHQVDLGNFRAWQTTGNWLWKDGSNPTSKDPFNHSLWPHAWYCIRKANMGLENLDNFVGSEEEKKIVQGQLYFFRAWWHFELMCYFGGLPYIDKSFSATESLDSPRLSFQEGAERVAADMRRAADLLPVDWDKTTIGKNTQGYNQLRINKIMALGYLGKAYLWAASPLMENGAQLGAIKSGATYKYNKEYAQKAAEAFGELLTMVENGETQYALAEFNYANPYCHEMVKGSKTSYSDIFYTRGQNWKQPGTVEAIFRGPSGNSDHNGNNSNWNTSKVFGPKVAGIVGHDKVMHLPTANLVDMYGMANGKPATKENGWDEHHPFKNRDPRFYHDIIFDGFRFFDKIGTELNEEQKQYQYLDLTTNSPLRGVDLGTRTGYFIQKLVPHECNESDNAYGWGDALHTYIPYMRLADIYLMYAEACAAVGGASAKSSNCALTAEDAINRIRERVKYTDDNGEEQHLGFVAPEYVADDHKFMDEIRRERAVELSFEGFRFNDLQRWLLLTEAPYTEKKAVYFDRAVGNSSNDWYKEHDPKDAEVENWREETILTRTFGTKHYWFPLPESDTYLFADFPQNPGW